MFHKVNNQLVKHTDGYSVGVKNREALVYKDELGEVTIHWDDGPSSISISPDTMKRFTPNGEAVDMTPEEKAVILPRIVDGWGAMSARPVVIEQ